MEKESNKLIRVSNLDQIRDQIRKAKSIEELWELEKTLQIKVVKSLYTLISRGIDNHEPKGRISRWLRNLRDVRRDMEEEVPEEYIKYSEIICMAEKEAEAYCLPDRRSNFL